MSEKGIPVSAGYGKHEETTSSPVGEHKSLLLDKALLAIKTAKQVKNWPTVLSQYACSRVSSRLSPAEIRFAFRDGTRMTCGGDSYATFPVFEVLIGDTYRLSVLAPLLPDAPLGLVDVGAHVGSATVALSRRLHLRAAVCAEPSPTSVARLRLNLGANRLEAKVVEAAVGAVAGSAVLDERIAGSGENQARVFNGDPNSAEPGATGGRLVPMVPFADLLASVGPGPSVVKMDCEGGEYAIVGGTASSAWSDVVAVLLEYHPVAGEGGWPWLRERLGDAGLQPLWHRPDQSRPGQGTVCLVRKS